MNLYRQLWLGICVLVVVAGCSSSLRPPSQLYDPMPQLTAALRSRPSTEATPPIETVLHRFAGAPHDGAHPRGGLIAVGDTFYGTTSSGGAYDVGTVYSVTKTGVEHVIHSFGPHKNDGEYPSGDLVNVDGVLYGATEFTIFSITTTGTERVVHHFSSKTDGSYANGSLVAIGKTLYGTTKAGGTYGTGTIFSVTTTGDERVLYNFGNADHESDAGSGLYPNGGLYLYGGSGPYLFGTTREGGENRIGILFEFSLLDHTLRDMHHFTHVPGEARGGSWQVDDPRDGAFPYAGVVGVGRLWGVTKKGGGFDECRGHARDGCGLLYYYDFRNPRNDGPGHQFAGFPTDGAEPTADLVYTENFLFGTTSLGGSHCDPTGCGIVFRFFYGYPCRRHTICGSHFYVLYSFAGGSDGADPEGKLLAIPELRPTVVYGTTYEGGGNPHCGSSGCGTVFELQVPKK